ncbi:GYD domain-containing protein [Falsiroseomonas sp. HW251]|uniref:GYD domain-containing protein n=1 Tax=Falsiroseomonas sp. HW251 TaxID=3390998 RepID=UPI003D3240F5
MPLFMYQGSYTAEALAAQLKHPENRVEAVARATTEALGGRLIGAWYSFGDHDFAIVMEMPDKESVAAIALAIAAGGALKSAVTTPLLSGAEFVAAMTKAQTVAKVYKPPR